jgi:ribosomal protein S18 acetylase RimI-like enzyme
MICCGKRRFSAAGQIAGLLNSYNKLQINYDARRVYDSPARYYPVGYRGLVLGSVAVQKLNPLFSEVKHLVVRPGFRRLGFAKKILNRGLETIDTPLSYATIREGNIPSLKLFSTAGFKAAAKASVGNHRILLVVKENA